MFRANDGAVCEAEAAWEPWGESSPSRVEPLAAAARAAHAADWQPSAYQASRQSAPVAMAGALLAVAGLISAFLWLNVSPPIAARHDLVTINLATTPPPPPRQAPAPPKQSRSRPNPPQIVAPPAILPMPIPSPVATAPQPAPPPTIAAPAAPAVPAPPAPPPAVASAGDLSSTMISGKAPAYPIESLRRHEQGTVVLKLLLGTDGTVSAISVSQSSGFDRLDQAALSAVRKWRWKPVMRSGQATEVQGLVSIPFILKH